MADSERRWVEVRLADDPERAGPGRIEGVLMAYGKRALDRNEVFEANALTWPAAGVILNEQHNRQAPIMRVVPQVEGGEVRISAALPNTQRGRDAATGIRNGTYRGLSVEFRAVKQRWQGSQRRIQSARLTAAGLVDDPSHDAPVQVREKQPKRKRWYW